MSIENETSLIEQAKNGDARALKILVDEYAPVIFRFAFNVCRNQDRAEHTTQETFVSLLSKLDQFDHKSKFSTWLYTIVSNHCLMLARSNKSRRAIPIGDEDGAVSEEALGVADEDPHTSLERSDMRLHLDNAIKKLPEDYRVVFVLRDLEGLSTEEVSQITNLSVPAVKSRLHRARASLRTQLSPLFEERNDD
jgi:RNA polymerase sigma-70 factor, ECF subfamily